jgi:hypothetical protein
VTAFYEHGVHFGPDTDEPTVIIRCNDAELEQLLRHDILTGVSIDDPFVPIEHVHGPAVGSERELITTCAGCREGIIRKVDPVGNVTWETFVPGTTEGTD